MIMLGFDGDLTPLAVRIFFIFSIISPKLINYAPYIPLLLIEHSLMKKLFYWDFSFSFSFFIYGNQLHSNSHTKLTKRVPMLCSWFNRYITIKYQWYLHSCMIKFANKSNQNAHEYKYCCFPCDLKNKDFRFVKYN